MRWSFFYKVLLKFGFQTTITETFASLYNTSKVRIKMNGVPTKLFILERGTRQVCLLSLIGNWIKNKALFGLVQVFMYCFRIVKHKCNNVTSNVREML